MDTLETKDHEPKIKCRLVLNISLMGHTLYRYIFLQTRVTNIMQIPLWTHCLLPMYEFYKFPSVYLSVMKYSVSVQTEMLLLLLYK